MPARGFIIGIENYPSMTSLAKSLPGTQKDSQDFYNWLVGTKKLNPADIWFYTDSKARARTGGTDMSDILAGIGNLVATGMDTTPELYLFFSGHGFFYTDRGGRIGTDVLVAGDFKTIESSGRQCLDVNELQNELRMSMGPGDHYYFVDACRNEITSKEISLGGLGLTPKRSRLGDPTVYTLYSTRRGKAVSAGSGFATRLIEALSGDGRAKAWAEKQPNTMVVLFDSVKKYVSDKLTSLEVDSRVLGPGDGHILRIQPPPQFACDIKIRNAKAADTFTVLVANGRGQQIATHEFKGSQHQFKQTPDDYYLTVTHPNASVVPEDNAAADLYDNCEVHFTKQGAHDRLPSLGGSPPPSMMAELSVLGLPGGDIEVRYLGDGSQIRQQELLKTSVQSGDYLIKIRDKDGASIRSQRVAIARGEQLALDLGVRPAHPLRDSILRHVPHDLREVDFSESLGPLGDDDPALWLSIMGASRIVEDPTVFSKLKDLPLATFNEYRKDDAPTYVLAGFSSVRKLSVAVSSGRDHQPVPAKPVKGIDNLFHFVQNSSGGFRILWLYPDGVASIALATFGLPNRATLVVVTEGDDGQLSIRQFILPIHALKQYLPGRVQSLLPERPLETIKFIARAQRDFEKHRAVEPREGRGREKWLELLYEKWTDPMMAIIASYELLRRGQRDHLPTVVRNLREYFAGIPDIAALASLSDLPHDPPKYPPLLLEGMLAVESRIKQPLPRNKLDYRGPWTMWRAAE